VIRVVGKLLVLFILVYAGVSIWYGRLEERLQMVPAARQAVVAPQPEEKTEILRKPDDYTIIVERNIFQAVVVKTEKDDTEPVQEELQPTQLKLSLMGTVFGKERDARAIISDDLKRQQDIYQVGDSVQGAMIKEINRGKVVLVVNGKSEVLTLKDREGGGPAYQPSATDYYQEPPEPQELPQPGIPVQEEGGGEQQIQDQGEGVQQPAPIRRPAVRPRPVRRPPVRTGQRTPRSTAEQPAAE